MSRLQKLQKMSIHGINRCVGMPPPTHPRAHRATHTPTPTGTSSHTHTHTHGHIEPRTPTHPRAHRATHTPTPTGTSSHAHPHTHGHIEPLIHSAARMPGVISMPPAPHGLLTNVFLWELPMRQHLTRLHLTSSPLRLACLLYISQASSRRCPAKFKSEGWRFWWWCWRSTSETKGSH